MCQAPCCVVQQGGASSTGPASGDGFEIILQGFNWESCKGVNGQPFWQVNLFWVFLPTAGKILLDSDGSVPQFLAAIFLQPSGGTDSLLISHDSPLLQPCCIGAAIKMQTSTSIHGALRPMSLVL